MDKEEAPSIEKYSEWLRKKSEDIFSKRYETYYSSVCTAIKGQFETSPFWTQFCDEFRAYDQEYEMKNQYPLWVESTAPDVQVKPYKSFLEKTYRKNILENSNWPDEPKGGWLLPQNWFAGINDIVRTVLVVKYLDGVEFVRKKIELKCEEHDIHSHVYFEAREEGYYAVHIYNRQTFRIPRLDWDTEEIKVQIEIQITTQLQENIRKLLHKYYEMRRLETRVGDHKWQWNYRSDEFAANYLGHILHYLEAMIVEIREKQKGKDYEIGVSKLP